MTTWIYQGTKQARGDGRRPQGRLVGLRCATPDPDGLMSAGGINPISPHCSMRYSAEIDL